MTWVDLSSAFTYGSKLTSTQMQNLRDNIAALAAGDSGAPTISIDSATDMTATESEIEDVCSGIFGTMKCVETASLSGAGSITLSELNAPGTYRLIGRLVNSDTTSNPWFIRINGDTGANYRYVLTYRSDDSSIGGYGVDDAATSWLIGTAMDDLDGAHFDFTITTKPGDNTIVFISGFFVGFNYLGSTFVKEEVGGMYDGASIITSLLIDSTAGDFTGNVYLFKVE